MWELFLVAPVVALITFVLAGRPDRRRDVEIDRWRKAAANPRRVTSLPGPLARVLQTTGGGVVMGYYELAPKIAYLAVMGADAMNGSDHVTVVAKLDEPGPVFTARPLPIVEGERVPNTGVQFKKDDDFMGRFLVDRSLDQAPDVPVNEADDKAIRKWLSPPIREALLDFPDGWLRVDGKAKTMAFTLYGPADTTKIEALIEAADIVFAEYGAEGGPSLLPEEEDEQKPAAAVAKTGTDGPKAPSPAKKKGSSGGPKPASAKR
jgi:hypothetical protein